MPLLANVNTWTLQSVASSSSGHVVLINNVGSDGATMFSPETFSTWHNLTIIVPIIADGLADSIDVGFISSTSAELTNTTPGTSTFNSADFYGWRNDLYNGYQCTNAGGTIANTGAIGSAFQSTSSSQSIMTLYFTDAGGGNMHLIVKRWVGGTTYTSSTITMTAPGFTSCKVAIGARTGGFAAVFGADDPVYAYANTLIAEDGQGADWGDNDAVYTTQSADATVSLNFGVGGGSASPFVVNFNAIVTAPPPTDVSATTIRGLMSTTIAMPDPAIVSGRPYLPLAHIAPPSSIAFTVGTSHIRVIDPPVPTVPHPSTPHYYSWDVTDLSDPPGSHGFYNLSTWPEHGGSGPDFLSSGVYRPRVADKIVYGAENAYHTYSRVVHFDASNVEHMWIDMGSQTQPFTWVIAGMINYYPYRTYGHYLLDAGTPTPTRDVDRDWTINDGLSYRSLMLYQTNSAVLATHTGADAVRNGKHVIAKHDEIARPRVFFGVFNGSASFIGSTDRYHTYGKTGRVDNHTHRYFLLGRRQNHVSNNLASHMTLFEVRFFNKALSAAERAAQYKQLASKWKFNKYGSGT